MLPIIRIRVEEEEEQELEWLITASSRLPSFPNKVLTSLSHGQRESLLVVVGRRGRRSVESSASASLPLLLTLSSLQRQSRNRKRCSDELQVPEMVGRAA